MIDWARPGRWAWGRMMDDSRVGPLTYAAIVWTLITYMIIYMVVVFAPVWIPILLWEWLHG